MVAGVGWACMGACALLAFGYSYFVEGTVLWAIFSLLFYALVRHTLASHLSSVPTTHSPPHTHTHTHTHAHTHTSSSPMHQRHSSFRATTTFTTPKVRSSPVGVCCSLPGLTTVCVCVACSEQVPRDGTHRDPGRAQGPHRVRHFLLPRAPPTQSSASRHSSLTCACAVCACAAVCG
jgi:hypothetical protein